MVCRCWEQITSDHCSELFGNAFSGHHNFAFTASLIFSVVGYFFSVQRIDKRIEGRARVTKFFRDLLHKDPLIHPELKNNSKQSEDSLTHKQVNKKVTKDKPTKGKPTQGKVVHNTLPQNPEIVQPVQPVQPQPKYSSQPKPHTHRENGDEITQQDTSKKKKKRFSIARQERPKKKNPKHTVHMVKDNARIQSLQQESLEYTSNKAFSVLTLAQALGWLIYVVAFALWLPDLQQIYVCLGKKFLQNFRNSNEHIFELPLSLADTTVVNLSNYSYPNSENHPRPLHRIPSQSSHDSKLAQGEKAVKASSEQKKAQSARFDTPSDNKVPDRRVVSDQGEALRFNSADLNNRICSQNGVNARFQSRPISESGLKKGRYLPPLLSVIKQNAAPLKLEVFSSIALFARGIDSTYHLMQPSAIDIAILQNMSQDDLKNSQAIVSNFLFIGDILNLIANTATYCVLGLVVAHWRNIQKPLRKATHTGNHSEYKRLQQCAMIATIVFAASQLFGILYVVLVSRKANKYLYVSRLLLILVFLAFIGIFAVFLVRNIICRLKSFHVDPDMMSYAKRLKQVITMLGISCFGLVAVLASAVVLRILYGMTALQTFPNIFYQSVLIARIFHILVHVSLYKLTAPLSIKSTRYQRTD